MFVCSAGSRKLRGIYEVLIGQAPPLSYFCAKSSVYIILYIRIYIYILWVICSVVHRMLSLMLYAQRHSSVLVRLLSVRYVHQFSTAFLPLPLVWLLGPRNTHQFSPAGSCAYLAVYEQSRPFVERAALMVKGQISSDISALFIDSLLSCSKCGVLC